MTNLEHSSFWIIIHAAFAIQKLLRLYIEAPVATRTKYLIELDSFIRFEVNNNRQPLQKQIILYH